MTKVEQYVATRIEHLSRQFTLGDSHGMYADNKTIKRQLAKEWGALSDAEKREAEPAYFAASLQYERTRPR